MVSKKEGSDLERVRRPNIREDMVVCWERILLPQNEKEDGDDDERANCGSRIEGLQIVQG